MQLGPGDALGAKYRLVERVGSGAAGDVWRAETADEGPRFAAKVLKAEHAGDTTLVERFVRERSVLMGLRHPGIVAVRDLVVEGETLAIVMDYVAGGSLRETVRRSPTLPPGDALSLTAEVLDALAFAHGKNVTHRDIKPDNILLTETWVPGARGMVRVTDFGIASVVGERDRQTTGLLGTPLYMSPELISHGRSTSSSDVYSAGIMLYELLSGHTPFAGPGTDFTVAYRHVTSLPSRLDVPDGVWDLLDSLLAKDPSLRPSAADAATTARRLAKKHAGLEALPLAEHAPEPIEDGRAATVLRGSPLHEEAAPPAESSPLSAERPDLGEAGQGTLLRPLPRTATAPARRTESAPVAEKPRRRPEWLTNRGLALGVAGILLLGALGAGVLWLFPLSSAAPEAAADTAPSTASQQDTPRPSGLATARTARYDPGKKTISLQITYSAQRSALAGDLLEAIPASGQGKDCPAVAWQGASAVRHQASTTGMTVACGWRLTNIRIPRNGTLTVTGSFPATIADSAALDSWLTSTAAATNEAITDAAVSSTSYPVQRLQDIEVTTPERTVSQTPLTVTLLPVWPNGTDTLNPLYQSPSTGDPSQLLQDIAGGESGVRFSDSCGGSVAVSSDGLVVTALSVTSSCRLRASVGNFTDLESTPFSITTRE